MSNKHVHPTFSGIIDSIAPKARDAATTEAELRSQLETLRSAYVGATDRIAQLLAATPQPSADMMLVPREPTNEMYLAACQAFTNWSHQCDLERDGEAPFTKGSFTHSDTYRAMLAAVPKLATTAQPAAPAEMGDKS